MEIRHQFGCWEFLSTPSARRATPPLPTGQGVYCCIFLSTPSARRATQIDTQQTGHLFHFYPRPPQGGRLYKLSHVLSRRQFLSTPSARRATP